MFTAVLLGPKPPITVPLNCPKLDCRRNERGYCEMFMAGEFDDEDFEDGDACSDYTPNDLMCGVCGAGKHGERELYGADADGCRGVVMKFWICPNGH